jgi:hypothetical protein
MKCFIIVLSFSVLLLEWSAEVEGYPNLVKCTQTVNVGSSGFKAHGTVKNPAHTCHASSVAQFRANNMMHL